MKQILWSLLICLTVVLCQNSYAQPAVDGGSFYLEESFFPVYVQQNIAQSSAGGGTNNVPTETGYGYDLRTTLGYVAWSQLLLGVTFNYYQVNTDRPTTSDYEGLTTNTSRMELGPTIGYIMGSWRIAATYFVWATKSFTQTYTDNSSGQIDIDETYVNSNGSGYQLALGWAMNLGAGWTIGPTLIYRNVVYHKQSLNVRASNSDTSYPSQSVQTNPIDSQLNPMITVICRF